MKIFVNMAYYDRNKSSIIDVQSETKVDQIIAVVTTRSVCCYSLICSIGHLLKSSFKFMKLGKTVLLLFHVWIGIQYKYIIRVIKLFRMHLTDASTIGGWIMGFFIIVLFGLMFYLWGHLMTTLNTISYKCLIDERKLLMKINLSGPYLQTYW